MGGRGNASSINSNEKLVSPLMAKVYYNAASKQNHSAFKWEGTRDSEIEKAIRIGNTDFIKSIHTKKEARRVSDYLNKRFSENNYKIQKLGSKEAVHKNQTVVQERRRLLSVSGAMSDKMHEFSKKPETGNTNIHDTSRTTTTYDRARKRRMKDFDAWWNGNRK